MDEPLPVLDLIGPTVDDDIRRAIHRYGPAAVKASIARLARKKPGPHKDEDWRILDEQFLKEDASHWLDGGNPFQRGADHSAAKWFEEHHPDENVQPGSVKKRIYRKLKKHRRYYVLVNAYWMSEAIGSYQRHLDTLRALSNASKTNAVWHSVLYNAESVLRDYKIKLRRAPPSEMTMREVEDAAGKAVFASSAKIQNVLQAILGHRRKLAAPK
jgi:hypothetical protein